MKEHKFPFKSHIGGWYISKSLCDKLLKHFYNKKNEWNKGLVGNGGETFEIDETRKECLEYPIYSDNENDKEICDYRIELQLVLNNYLKKYEWANNVPKFNVKEIYNFQHYKKNQGFKVWHHERSNLRHTNRILTFMTYLNDVNDGGTEFLYQKITSPAKKGLTLIWPADWTHTHRGQISKTKEKSIITGWFNYE